MEERRNDYPYTTAGSIAYPRPGMMPRQPGYGGAPQPVTYPQQPRDRAAMMVQDAQVLTQSGFKPLSKEEREEAARIAEEAGFSFEGYQVVRREFFSHKFDPTLTIRSNGITFNNACISRLDEVVYVQVLINPDTGKLVVRPCDEGARDAVRWCIAREDRRKSRQISCSMFTAKLYDLMGWETLYRYKMQGTRISYQGEQLYVFDLTSTEVFIPSSPESTDPDSKAKKKSTVRFLADWRDSFGLPVREHTQSMQVNLDEGYEAMEDVQANANEQMPMEIVDQETGEVTKV